MPDIFTPDFSVNRKIRENQKNQKGVVLWFTGLSAAGKTSIANALETLLAKNNNHSYILDGDVIRKGLSSDLSFDKKSREENLRRIRHVAEMFCDAGIITLVTFISPFQSDREKARLLLKSSYVEIYVNTSLEIAEKRDPKGLYKKARNGEIKNFTGIDSPYETPQYSELVLDSSNKSVSECATQVFNYMLQKKYILKVT
ncbi:MAG: adenylyl-sulfate kinase [Burkholderiaceae bacterium]|nr:MAG: adenylyl-sulfate kinase [Burkholderiaceae bacterium]|tara:strand:+ start:65 stop:664 length:600 start_codon:yes stop_codon:yes gene_type:complete